MTTPAAVAQCDICQQEAAFISVMQLADYSAIKVGLACLPEWMLTMATSMITPAGTQDHYSVPDDCEVCWAIHALMNKPAPRPGDPAPDTAAAAVPLEAAAAAGPGPGPAAPLEAAAAAPAVSTLQVPDPDRQLTATAAQKSLLATFGIPSPDWAQCPADGTVTYTAPGFMTFVCPFCGGQFTPELPAAAAVVPDSEDGRQLTVYDEITAREQAGNSAAAGDTQPPLTPDDAGVPF